MKVCANCREAKPLGEFYRDKRRRDGLYPSCKTCHCARTRRWSRNNPDQRREIQRDYRAENPGRYAAYARASRATNPAAHDDAAARYRERHRSLLRERSNEWFRQNPDMACAYVGERRAAKLQQTLPHTREAVQAIYERARLLTEVTGVRHHVDHIVPLRGENVCGLHVPWNLQCLPAAENCRKHNRFEPAA